jgi:pantothenate kinase
MTVVSSLEHDVERVCDLVNQSKSSTGRTIIGVAGPPASGKSTLAEAVVDTLNEAGNIGVPRAVLLPMDGYHLDNGILESRGLLQRKGAPETFDALGFCDAVRALTDMTREAFFPKFDREMDLAIANAIVVRPGTPVVVVEGNYLLLASDPWASLQDVFAATVFVSPTLNDLRDRLIKRWLDHGLDQAASIHRAENNDLPNAELVLEESAEADLSLTQNSSESGHRHAY